MPVIFEALTESEFARNIPDASRDLLALDFDARPTSCSILDTGLQTMLLCRDTFCA